MRGGSRGRGKGKGKGGVCFLYIIDKCRKGDSCEDRHPDKYEVRTMRERMENTACRFGGDCTRRDCVFKHPPGHKGSRDDGK
eukprot:CAMPEP_0195126264 /NCGR_PEP_ID=MMETSP0448-20130528/134589_1 /TAXON_ID=66468 /ORGANISM="Heterocapsa triquestra, Strain CCMP 448" /LENGTH=81 /DNA_ID=CAMNT_0040163943 /DNA_START=14 /DNA_END=259 /DNA_ORIENTATION=+